MDSKRKPYSQLIWQITQDLQSEKDIGQALSDSLSAVLDATGCTAGSIWLLDEKSGRLFPAVNHGPEDITNITIEVGQGIAGTVVREGKPLLVPDVRQDDRFSHSVDDETGLVTKNLICVPILDGETAYGCIELMNYPDTDGAEEEFTKLLQLIASLSQIAIKERMLQTQIPEKGEPIISVRGLVKDFTNGELVSHVLKGINLDIYRDEFVVILGESGCGKTTLVNIISGMDKLTKGSLIIEGQDFSHPTEQVLTDFRRQYIGFVFQSYNLMPNLTAQENVQFIAELVEHPMKAEEAIARVGLTDRANNFPGALSGGQQQRVAIARAIVKQPHVIFADEPTAALDYQTSIEVLKVFENIKNQKGTTVVMITHNPEIARMADRVIKLKNGVVSSVRYNFHPLKAEELSW